jgi:hypothetical protein
MFGTADIVLRNSDRAEKHGVSPILLALRQLVSADNQ